MPLVARVYSDCHIRHLSLNINAPVFLFLCARNPLAVSTGRFAARSSAGGTRRTSRMRVGQRRNGNRYPNLPKGFNTTSANDVRQMALRSPIAAPVPGTPTASKAVTVSLLVEDGSRAPSAGGCTGSSPRWHMSCSGHTHEKHDHRSPVDRPANLCATVLACRTW